MNPDVVNALKAADTPPKVQDIFAKAVASKEAENKAQEEREKAAANKPADDSRPYIVAVTACPNGIAHTYMAEEKFENKLIRWALTSKLKQTVLKVSSTV